MNRDNKQSTTIHAIYKTTARKTKTEFYWSETGLATRPKSQTTSLDVDSCILHPGV